MARVAPLRRDRGHALRERGRRGGGAAPRPDPRPLLLGGRVARATSRRPGSSVEEVDFVEKRRPSTTGSRGPAARARRRTRVRALLGDQIADGGLRRHEDPAEGAKALSGDHRRPRHASRRPGHHRPRGVVPHAPQPRVRDERRRGRHAGQGRRGRRGDPGLRHRHGGGRAGRSQHVARLRPGPLRGRRDPRGGRRGHRHDRLHHRGRPGARHAPRLLDGAAHAA